MGLCLEAACKLAVVDRRAGKDFKRLAKHRRSHWTFPVGCLLLSRLTPRFTVCLGFSSDHE